MNSFLKALISILIGYTIGTINPSYLIAKIKGFDIRKRGSGNAGASNALIVFGKAVGVFCAFFVRGFGGFSPKRTLLPIQYFMQIPLCLRLTFYLHIPLTGAEFCTA